MRFYSQNLYQQPQNAIMSDKKKEAPKNFSLGWKIGLEPTTPGTTIQCSNRLSYIHHVTPQVLLDLRVQR